MPPLWRQVQRKNFTDLSSLLSFLLLDETPFHHRPPFPLNVPYRLAEKMEKGSLDDPLLRQFLPLQEEQIKNPLFVADPVQDKAFQITPRLLQKYQGRALLMPTSACAMHCRYCFRQNYPYETADHPFEREVEAIKKDSTLHEVILSGGDPLSLGEKNLSDLLSALDQIPHLATIRFHTRFPIGIPERIDPPFLELLSSLSKQVIFILHINHAKELDGDVLASISRLQRLGIPVLQQGVLLRGVNDDFSALHALYRLLIKGGVIPYYLHLLDPVEGSSHFAVSEKRGVELIGQLQSALPGYGVPRLVKEEPHRPSKTWII